MGTFLLNVVTKQKEFSMILQAKHNHIAYRCPGCGYTIFGLITSFTAAQDMIRLKCQCGESELTMQFTKDKKAHITVPCLFCRQPHHYTVSQSILLGKDLFLLNCPYTNMDIAFVGQEERINEALQQSQTELEQLFAQLGQDEDEQEEEKPHGKALPDVMIYDILRFLVKELEAEEKIHCPCGEHGPYELDLTEEGIRVYCTACGAAYLFPCDSVSSAESFLAVDEIFLAYTP